MNRTFLLFAVMGLSAAWAVAQEAPESPPADETVVIRETVKAYVAAFNQGDAAALASYWSEDAEFIAPSGQKYEGRQAIREGFESFFQDNQGAQLEIDIASLLVDAPDSAVEEGTARLTLADEPPSETTYVASYRKIDGSWKLASVRETDKAPSHYEQLKSLEWLIGQWSEQGGENVTVRTVCRWTKNKNFISRSFAVSLEGQPELEGTQVIGWDPDKQVIRSWLFDSDGSFAAGLWAPHDDHWKITNLQVLHDGRKASSVNILRYVDENTFTWESTNREVDGEVLPNIGPVTIVRQTSDN